jgi:hypothetical protein
VRHDKAGGKVVWCTLELPSQDADVVGRGRRPQANTRTTPSAKPGELRPFVREFGLQIGPALALR